MKRECKDKAILDIYEEVKAVAKELYPHFFENSDLKFFINDSTKQLGHCKAWANRQSVYDKYGNRKPIDDIRCDKAEITLSKYVTDLDLVRKTLVHEFGHFVAPLENHSFLWAIRADKIGEKWGIVSHRNADHEESLIFRANMEKPKYAIRCTQCGQIIRRTRLSHCITHPQEYYCGKCGGTLERIEE